MNWTNKLLSNLGSSLEWFDFALYGYFGTILTSVFFNHAGQPKWLGLLVTYAIFAIGYAARPIGGLVFGYLGDKCGRLLPLRLSPLCMMVTTTAMACIPSYQAIGYISVLILLSVRIIQGILLGGEYSTNMVYLCEASEKRRYLWGSLASCSGSFGILLGSITASLFFSFFSTNFMIHYGWRIAFLLAIPLGLVTYIVRKKLDESSAFNNVKSEKSPLINLFKNYKKNLLLCISSLSLHATSFYFVFIFLPIFINKFRNIGESITLTNNSLFLIVHIGFILLFGYLIKPKNGPIYLLSISVAFMILTIPLFHMIAVGNYALIIIAVCIFSIMTAMNASIIPGLLSELMPSEVRCSGLGLVFNLGFGILGGIVPFISLLLIKLGRSIMIPEWYLVAAALISGTSALILLTRNKL